MENIKKGLVLDQNFSWDYLRNRKYSISTILKSTEPQTAANYGVFAILPFSGVIEEIWETHGTACSSTGTINVEILSSGQALDAGKAILSSALALNTTANIPQRGTLSVTISNRQFARGDRLALKDAGTLTATVGLAVTVLVRIP